MTDDFVVLDEIHSDTEERAPPAPRKRRKVSFFQHCNYCVQKFQSSEELQRHVAHSHRIQCHFCADRQLENEEKYFLHFRDKHKDVPTRCVDCDIFFHRAKEFLAHHATDDHVWNSKRDVQCVVCAKDMPSMSGYYLHIKRYHPKISLRCERCDRTQISVRSLVKHVVLGRDCKSAAAAEVQSQSERGAIKCVVCLEGVASKVRYQAHITRYHPDISLTCSKCDEVQMSVRSLVEHLVRNHT